MIVSDLSGMFYQVLSCKAALVKEPLCSYARDRSLVFSYLVSGLAGSALLSLAFWHTFLITSGQTTIEFYRNQVSKAVLEEDFINPYDYGWKENLKEFFNVSNDAQWFLVLLPICVSKSGHIEDF